VRPRLAAVAAAAALVGSGACGDGDPPDTPDADPMPELRVDVKDLALRRDDLPERGWVALDFEPGAQDPFDRCIETVADPLEGRIDGEAKAAYAAGADLAGSYAVTAGSAQDAERAYEALEPEVLPCVVGAFETIAAAEGEPGIRTVVHPPVEARSGVYEPAVLARTIATDMTGPLGVTGGLRFDFFAVRHDHALLLVFFTTDGALTPREEDDALAAVADRMGVERLEALE
jgi:hypothetical protein